MYACLSDAVHTPCSDNPCENGGKCMTLDYGDYRCQCPHDFGGMHCEGQKLNHLFVLSVMANMYCIVFPYNLLFFDGCRRVNRQEIFS